MLEKMWCKPTRYMKAVAVNIGIGGPFKLKLMDMSPTHKIPALMEPKVRDRTPIKMFKFSAILICLVSKTGQFLLCVDGAKFQVN